MPAVTVCRGSFLSPSQLFPSEFTGMSLLHVWFRLSGVTQLLGLCKPALCPSETSTISYNRRKMS